MFTKLAKKFTALFELPRPASCSAAMVTRSCNEQDEYSPTSSCPRSFKIMHIILLAKILAPMVSLPFRFLEPFEAYWLRDAPTNLTFDNCALCPRCIDMFRIYLRISSDMCHLHHKLVGFYNRDEKCLLRGTDWVFK